MARQIAAAHRPEPRNRGQQRPGIGMLRRTEDLLHRAAFHRFSAVHHQYPIGDIGDHPHIVSNKNHPHRHLFLQHGNELKNLSLNRHIQRRGGLIGNQYRRTAGQRHRDHYPLTHPAGELMGIARKHRFRLGDPDLIEHFLRFAQRRIMPQPLVQTNRFGNLLSDSKHRV